MTQATAKESEIVSSTSLSRRSMIHLSLAAVGSFAPVAAFASPISPLTHDVRDYGARGDGRTIDTAAIQKAIDAASNAGGGRVLFSAGTYLSFSIELRSHVSLEFGPDCVLQAAIPSSRMGYDAAEPQISGISSYQDFGHNHWHNSLLWGENLEEVSLLGPGLLYGQGLQKGDGAAEEAPGAGNKVIALKNCTNILLRDLKILDAGHFGILASGVTNLTIENLLIDTKRDGIDIDACRNVHISNCTVNAPWDDAIVLKSSYSLGKLRACEQVTITSCTVYGCYALGSVVHGTFLPFTTGFENDPPSHVGRIKIGTETNGDVRNIAISNCVFQGCRGLTIVCEDGGHIEDVVVSDITMRDSMGAPLFLRLGDRLRGPKGTTMGSIRRINVDGLVSWNARPEVCALIAGLPGYPIEDVTLRNIHLQHASGGTLRKGAIPENGKGYPDLELFGPTPAQGFYIRHADKLDVADVVISSEERDPRPIFVLDDVLNSTFRSIQLEEPDRHSSDPFVQGRNLKAVRVIADDGRDIPISPYAP